MASVAMLIGGALQMLSLSLVVVICFIDYQRTVLMLRERDMI